VELRRLRGSFWRVGSLTTTFSMMRSMGCGAAAGASFLVLATGWATLELSR